MDYVEGNTLSELDFHIDAERNEVTALERTKPLLLVHGQLVDVFIQLCGLKFSTIGALRLPDSASSTEAPGPAQKGASSAGDGARLETSGGLSSHVSDTTVCNRPVSVDVLTQENEGRKLTMLFHTRRHSEPRLDT